MPRRARREAIAVSPFIAALEARVGAMSADELRAVVLTFAQSLEPAERPGFLERFGASLVRPGDEVGALLADLEVLEEEAAATGEPDWGEQDEWYDRHGWSPDDETAEPDWAPGLMDLIRRCGRLFLSGGLVDAADVYERLFGVAAAAMDNGWSVAVDPDDDQALAESEGLGVVRRGGSGRPWPSGWRPWPPTPATTRRQSTLGPKPGARNRRWTASSL